MIYATITDGDDRGTNVSGKTVEEIITKIREYHTLTEFERQHFENKGTLTEQLSSGWYIT